MDALPANWNTAHVQCLQAYTQRELGGLRIGDMVVTADGKRGQVTGFGCATLGAFLVLVAAEPDRYPTWRAFTHVTKSSR